MTGISWQIESFLSYTFLIGLGEQKPGSFLTRSASLRINEIIGSLTLIIKGEQPVRELRVGSKYGLLKEKRAKK